MVQLPNIGYLSKDYEAFRSDLLNLIPQFLPEWTDYSESDPGVTMIELLSYALDILSYYQDRANNEAYLPTATQKQSVIDLCRLIGYRLSTAVPSQSTQVFQINTQTADYHIALGYQISTQSTPYDPAIIFETTQDLIIPAGSTGMETDANGNYLYSVPVIQGQTYANEILGSSDAQPNQTFTLKNPGVIIDGPQGSSLHVYVDQGSGFEEWTDITDSFNAFTSSGKQYTWEIDAQDYMTIKFGDGTSGLIPAQGTNNIKATYRVGGGANTDVGVNSITVLVTQDPNIQSTTNIIAASGGADEETIDHAKTYGPLSLRTSDRAVTGTDYETLSEEISGVQWAKATTNTSQPNTVTVYLAPVGGGIPSSTLTQSVYNKLNDVKTITTSVIMANAKYLTLRVTMNVLVTSGTSMSQTENTIQQILNTNFDLTQRPFSLGAYISLLYQMLNNITGVTYVDITRFTVNPRVDVGQSTGNPSFSTITTNSGATYDGLWKVEMTSATAFTVYYNPSGDGTTWVQDGTGTMGTAYTSVSGGTGITFTLTAGTPAVASGDYWTFRTSPYLGNITINDDEILLLDSDVVIDVTGGV